MDGKHSAKVSKRSITDRKRAKTKNGIVGVVITNFSTENFKGV